MHSRKQPLQHDIGDVYLHHRGWLLRWLQGRTQCPDRASDLVQDTFIRLLNNGPVCQACNPQALIMTVAKRVLIDYWRRQNIEQTYLNALTQLPESYAPAPEHQYLRLETLLEVDQLLAGLPVPVRTAFLLSQLDGLKQADIARKLNVSVSTVKRYLVRASTQFYLLHDARLEACSV